MIIRSIGHRRRWASRERHPFPASVAALALLVASLTMAVPSTASASAASVPAGLPAAAEWLTAVNEYRTASGLAPVAANDSASAGLSAHLRFLQLTPDSLRTGAFASAHTENPASPYTLTGTLPPAGATNQPPIARGSVSPPTGPAPLTVTASSAESSDPEGSIASRTWQWGDGTTSTLDGSHIYSSPGTYTVTLTVSDAQGATGSATFTVTVTGIPAPAAPSSVSAGVRFRTVTVRWKDNSANETGFTVTRESQARNGSWGGATTVATVTANGTQITDSPARGTYRYTVKAFNAGGSSAGTISNAVSV